MSKARTITIVLASVCVFFSSAWAKYGGGQGTEVEPYEVHTAAQLNEIGLQVNQADWDKHFILMADIDMSAYSYTTAVISTFTGVFDGAGHKISNLTIDTGAAVNRYLGLFGKIEGEQARVLNLGLENVSVGSGKYSGGLCGYNDEGTISNCYVNGSVTGDFVIGGLCGKNNGTIDDCSSTGSVIIGEDSASAGGLAGANRGTINNCQTTSSVIGGEYSIVLGGLCGDNSGVISNSYASGSVTGGDYVGGLCGFILGATITGSSATNDVTGQNYVGGLLGANSSYVGPYGWGGDRDVPSLISSSYATGSVTGGFYVGGLCGANATYEGIRKESIIINCYATGSVTGDYFVGGLCGENADTISHCYATGSVTGVDDVGGLCGRNSEQPGPGLNAIINECFWDVETSEMATSDGGTGLPTAQMQTASTFTDAGWDFLGETVNGIEDIWFIPQEDYPRLWWEGMQVPLKLTPRTLNCRSKGNWVKAHLMLPEGYTVADVDPDRPAVLHSLGFPSNELEVFVNEDEQVEVEAAFAREDVCSLTGAWPEALTVAGFLADGNIFLGNASVRTITPGRRELVDLSAYWLQGACERPSFCEGRDLNCDSIVNLLDFALLQNSSVEFISE